MEIPILPLQLLFPESNSRPVGQEQVNDPAELWHVWEQPPLEDEHSLISDQEVRKEKIRNKNLKKALHFLLFWGEIHINASIHSYSVMTNNKEVSFLSKTYQPVTK